MKGPDLTAKFAPTLRWEDLVGAVVTVYFDNRAATALSGFSAEDRAWGLVESMRQSVWDRAQAAWGRLTGRPPILFPLSVDFVAFVYNALVRLDDPAGLKAWLRKTHAAGE